LCISFKYCGIHIYLYLKKKCEFFYFMHLYKKERGWGLVGWGKETMKIVSQGINNIHISYTQNRNSESFVNNKNKGEIV